jgi:hypothetical protein
MTSSKSSPDFTQFKMDVSKEELDAASNAAGSGGASKYLDKGNHEVEIMEAVWDGQARADETWFKLKVTFKDAKDRTIREWMLIPTTSAKYGPDKKDGVFLKLQRFLNALGFVLDRDSAEKLVPSIFKDPSKLLGLKLKIDVGYRAHHVNYVSKGNFTLSTSKGDSVNDSTTGKPVQFEDRKSAEEYCAVYNLDFSKYPDVQRYSAASTPNKLGGLQPAKKASGAFSL